MARQLFDVSIFNALSSAGALGAGWKLAFYTGGTSTPITTYNARTAGSANANPVIADANGRFSVIWIEDNQTIKWVLSNASDVVQVTVDNFLIPTTPAATDTNLAGFLANATSSPLAVAYGGTGATAAATALSNLGALPAAGGTVTGNIVRSSKGIHPYFNNSSMTGGQIYIQAAGADPTSNPGDIVFEY